MNPAILQFVTLGLESLPGLIRAGADLASEAQSLAAQVQTFAAEKRDPSPQEWAAQNAKLSAALKALHQAAD